MYGEERGKLYVAFIDYRKTVDSVSREQSWKILRKVGNPVLTGIMFLSEFFDCPSGMKHGTLEHPSLQSIYIDSLAEFVRKIVDMAFSDYQQNRNLSANVCRRCGSYVDINSGTLRTKQPC